MSEAGAQPSFPWAAAMRIGIGVMGLSPAEFWKLTPSELDMAARILIGEAATPPARRDLDDLMRLFPDARR